MGEDGEEIVGDDSDDFIVLRRDVSAGRPVMSGPVLYSVAESVAQPRWNIATQWQAFPAELVVLQAPVDTVSHHLVAVTACSWT